MRLSIIIPVYNVEKYIRKCLNSIFSQQTCISDYEVIIVNDGTIDNSMEIIRDFFLLYPNIKVINQKNQGLSAARNTGIEAAQGDYIWFVDSDDWVEKGSIPNILAKITEQQVEVFMFRIREYEETTGQIRKERHLFGDKIVKDVDFLNILKSSIDFTPIQIYVINRSFILSNNLFFLHGILHEDMEYAPRMLIRARKIMYVPIVNYCYLRRQTGSITTANEKTKERVKSLMIIENTLSKENIKPLGKRNRKALQYTQMIIHVCTFHLVQSQYKTKEDITNVLPFFNSKRSLVFSNILFRVKVNSFICRCLYLISPYFLLKMRKGI